MDCLTADFWKFSSTTVNICVFGGLLCTCPSTPSISRVSLRFLNFLRSSALSCSATIQFVIFNPLSYYFEGTIGFNVNASFPSRPVSRLIRWYNEPSDTTKEFWWKAIQFHETFRGFKITNCIKASLIFSRCW